MKHPLKDSFADRQKAALAAKKALLERAKAVVGDESEVAAKRAEKVAIAAAREARRVEKQKADKAEAERKAIEKAAAIEAAALAAKIEAEEKVAREILEAAERKAERDRRYAARKERNR